MIRRNKKQMKKLSRGKPTIRKKSDSKIPYLYHYTKEYPMAMLRNGNQNIGYMLEMLMARLLHILTAEERKLQLRLNLK